MRKHNHTLNTQRRFPGGTHFMTLHSAATYLRWTFPSQIQDSSLPSNIFPSKISLKAPSMKKLNFHKDITHSSHPNLNLNLLIPYSSINEFSIYLSVYSYELQVQICSILLFQHFLHNHSHSEHLTYKILVSQIHFSCLPTTIYSPLHFFFYRIILLESLQSLLTPLPLHMGNHYTYPVLWHHVTLLESPYINQENCASLHSPISSTFF